MTSWGGGGSRDATDGWARIKALFLEALERAEADRPAFLAAACAGDEVLRQEVESLLASDSAAGSFGETPAAELIGPFAAPPPDPSPRLTVGSRLDAYEITGFIGAGGMGEVYCARDTRLRRQVAIKTVPALSADASAKLRLLREARHASSLNHSNICTIHEIAESSDLPCIVMEYVDGRSLAQIRRERTPGPAGAVAYGIQIADAVAHAHDRGIVHRDLKSSNVVIDRSGHAVVLDFGLAKRLPTAEDVSTTDATLTAQHALAGTLSYMAPEVLLGARADARGDIWAIGVLLHEMATGTLPFDGRTPFETSSAIINEPPRALPRSVPLALRLVIERCLVKDPAGRYQRAAEVRDALDAIRRRRTWPVVSRLLLPAPRRLARIALVCLLIGMLVTLGAERLWRWIEGRSAPSIATVAVLPFENATGDPEVQYFAEGITDALVTQIGALGTVRVISRASSQRMAGSGMAITGIGAALGAGALVQGTLRRASDRVHVDVRLTDAARGSVLWSDEFERAAGEILVLQADVVRAVAAGLQTRLHARAQARLSMVRAVNPESYEAYLKGRFQWNRRTQQSLQLAVEQFTRALELDPTFAPAHAALADCYNQLGTVMVGVGSPRDYRPRAAAEAIKALQIDPDSAEAHAALGYVRHYDWQWEDAERAFRRAIELNPSYPLVRLWYANMLMSRGRLDEALREVFIGHDLDPFSLVANTNVGWVLQNAGRTEEAVAHLTRTLELDPDYPQAHMRLAGALGTLRRFDTALEHAVRFTDLTNRSAFGVAMLAELHAQAGNRSQARQYLNELGDVMRRQYVPPSVPVQLYMELGELDAAFAWLEKAYEERSNHLAYIGVERGYDRVRHDPRYQSLLERTGLR